MTRKWSDFLRQQTANFDNSIIYQSEKGLSAYADLEDPILAPIDSIGVLRVSGPDAREFLQAQLTSNIEEIQLDTTNIGGYCTPKGRLLAIFRILRDGDDFLLLSDSNILPAVLRTLKLYVFRLKVALDLDFSRIPIGLIGPNAHKAWAHINASQSAITNTSLYVIQPSWKPLYLNCIGLLVLAPESELIGSWKTIMEKTKLGDSDQWKLFELRSGLPHITKDTRAAFIPQSVNLDHIGGVSFTKGCYPGQEIIARVRYLGKIKYRMARATVQSGSPPQPGDSIFGDLIKTRQAGTVVNTVNFFHNSSSELLVTVPAESKKGTTFYTKNNGALIRLVEVI